MVSAKITGTGSAFPEKVLTNDELAKDLAVRNIETNDQWIQERTGIRARRISAPGKESETNSSLGSRAAKQALEMAGKKVTDIDLIIYATATPDTVIPSTACWLQQHLGALNASAFDVNAACSGFVYGLTIADKFIRSGASQTALVVGADVLSAHTDWNDRGSCILLGDGAGAVIVEKTATNDPSGILSTYLGADGTKWDLFSIRAGGSKLPVTPELLAAGENKMKMQGREMFKVATRTLAENASKAIQGLDISVNDIDWVVPHQANLRIIEAVAARLEIPMSKVIINIDRYGNTSSATIPTALDEAVRDGRIKKGHLVLFDAFGAGLTHGSALIRW